MKKIVKESPLVSLVLFSYNHERYIKEAVDGALSQTYSPLEIILSDDCSTDNTYNIIERIVANYSGKHYITINRNKKNLGLVSHLNKVFSMASGQVIVLCAGDDVSLPNRVTHTVVAFEKDTDLKYVDLEKVVIDENGYLINNAHLCQSEGVLVSVNLKKYISKDPDLRFNGAGRAIHRSVITTFGPLMDNAQTEDTTYNLRCLMAGRGLFMGIPGILYRQHPNSLSAQASLHKMSVDGISCQYKFDADLALEKRLIEKKTYLDIISWINISKAIRVVDRDVFFKKKITDIVVDLLKNKDLRGSQKIRIIIRLLAVILRNG